MQNIRYKWGRHVRAIVDEAQDFDAIMQQYEEAQENEAHLGEILRTFVEGLFPNQTISELVVAPAMTTTIHLSNGGEVVVTTLYGGTGAIVGGYGPKRWRRHEHEEFDRYRCSYIIPIQDDEDERSFGERAKEVILLTVKRIKECRS